MSLFYCPALLLNMLFFYIQILIYQIRLTLEAWALNPAWDISISKEEVKFPDVAEEECIALSDA